MVVVKWKVGPCGNNFFVGGCVGKREVSVGERLFFAGFGFF